MSKETYSELLRNPLWQKKRLEILERESFTCQLCSDKETELHIHHKKYIRGKLPWEYENDNFQVLCKHCHGVISKFNLKEYIPIVASKVFKPYLGCIIVTTIFEDLFFNVLSLSIDRYYPDGKIENIIIIEDGQVESMAELFQQAKKLM